MEIINNSVLQLLYEHRYIFVFIGAVLEGNFIMILSGVLFRFGYFNFWGLLTVLITGYFFNGVFWYLLGRIAGYTIIDKHIRRLRLGKKIIDKLEEYFQKHDVKTIFLTRITYGISMFSFMIAGGLKMKWKKFLWVSLAGSVVWVLMVVGMGYGFGAGLQSLSRVLKGITIGLIIVLIILIILISLSFIYWMRYFAKTQFVKDLENHDSPILSKIGETIRRAFHRKKEDEL